MRSTRHTAWIMIVGLLVVIPISGCGISTDETPRALPVSTTSTTPPANTAGNDPWILYFVQAERLVPVTRPLPDRTPDSVMESLFVPPTATEGSGMSSSIPGATALNGTSLKDGVLRVDLSEGFEGVIGTARNQAIGQMVLSETGLPGVDALSFSTDGTPLKVTTSRGDVNVVRACDYADLLADPADDTVNISQVQRDLLAIRQRELSEDCP